MKLLGTLGTENKLSINVYKLQVLKLQLRFPEQESEAIKTLQKEKGKKQLKKTKLKTVLGL